MCKRASVTHRARNNRRPDDRWKTKPKKTDHYFDHDMSHSPAGVAQRWIKKNRWFLHDADVMAAHYRALRIDCDSWIFFFSVNFVSCVFDSGRQQQNNSTLIEIPGEYSVLVIRCANTIFFQLVAVLRCLIRSMIIVEIHDKNNVEYQL